MLETIAYFLFGLFSLVITYAAATVVWIIARREFEHGGLEGEWKPASLAALADAVIVMLPIAMIPLPGTYSLIALLPGSVIMGLIYHRMHPEWPPVKGYVFALLYRAVQMGLLLGAWMAMGGPGRVG